MADNVTVTDISNFTGGAYTNAINLNFEKLANAFDEVIWKDGRESLSGDIDANGYRFLNLPEPLTDLEPVRRIDLVTLVPVSAAEAAQILLDAQQAAEDAQDAAEAAEQFASTVDYSQISAERALAEAAAADAAQSAQQAADAVNDLVTGNQYFTGGIFRDSQFYLTLQGSNPVVNFDTDDYLRFSRTDSTLSIVIAGQNRYNISTAGMRKAGAGSVLNHQDPTMQSGSLIIKTASAPDPVTYQKGDLIATRAG